MKKNLRMQRPLKVGVTGKNIIMHISFKLMMASALCLNVNLISNIGFGPDATHTLNIKSKDFNVKRYEMEFPLKHQIFEKDTQTMNAFIDSNYFNQPSYLLNLIFKIIEKVKSFFK